MLNKRVEDITFTDIEEFCNQKIAENSSLDYKKSFHEKTENEQVGKIFSAMANAHGGLVLFGIKEGGQDSQGRGLPGELVGLDIDDNPIKRLKSIGLCAIYPPVMPEFKLCEINQKPGKAIVIARIFESDSTPHRVGGKVYLRTNDISVLKHDGKEASIEELEFLLNRRDKALAIKQRLIERATMRCFINTTVQLSVYCIPTYPSQPLVDVKELIQIAENTSRWEAFRHIEQWHTAHESLCAKFDRQLLEEPRKPTCTELNAYGLVYYNAYVNIFPAERGESPNYPVFDADTCILILWCIIKAAESFYLHSSYSGLVDIAMQLEMSTNQVAALRSGKVSFERPIDRKFMVKHQALTHNIAHHDSVEALFRQFLWAANGTPHSLKTVLSYALSAIEKRHE